MSRLLRGLQALPRRQLVLALCVGFVVRIGIHALVASHAEQGDPARYDALARGILLHGTFGDSRFSPLVPSVSHAPLYPAFLALVFVVFGHNYIAVWMLQAALNLSAAATLAATLALRVPRVALGVLWAMCLSPFEAVYTGALLSESVGSALLVAAFCAPYLWRGWRGTLLCGILLGLTALTREVYLLAPLPAAALIFWRDRKLTNAALLLVGCMGVVLPWSARNAAVTGRLIPISQGRLGFSLWVGTWAVDADFTLNDAKGRERVFPDVAWVDGDDRARIERAQHQPDEQALDQVYRQSFWRHMKSQPLLVLERWIQRAPRMWFGTRFDIFELQPACFPRGSKLWIAVKGVLFLLNGSMVLLGLIGLVLCARRSFLWAWWVLPLAYTFAVYFPLNSFESRYSQPVLPFLMVFSVVTAFVLVGRIAKVRRARSISPERART
jgi:hypothetical protein